MSNIYFARVFFKHRLVLLKTNARFIQINLMYTDRPIIFIFNPTSVLIECKFISKVATLCFHVD